MYQRDADSAMKQIRAGPRQVRYGVCDIARPSRVIFITPKLPFFRRNEHSTLEVSTPGDNVKRL